MANNKNFLRLTLAQAHQALQQTHTRIAALEAELATGCLPAQVVENAAAPFAAQTPPDHSKHNARFGPMPITEQGSETQSADTLINRYMQRLEILHYKESVELHGGIIAVESQVERGTTFMVCLSLASGESENYAPNSRH